jgi:hypothetical protein
MDHVGKGEGFIHPVIANIGGSSPSRVHFNGSFAYFEVNLTAADRRNFY